MKFRDIKQIPNSHYAVNIPWSHLSNNIIDYQEDYHLDLDPEFQRGHIWTEAQQIKYIEFILSSGQSGRNIYFNCPGWGSGIDNQMILVDGKQRLTAAQQFLNDNIPAFGYFYSDFEDKLPFDVSFRFYVNKISDYNELLEWYISLNSGVAHTGEELERVRRLMDND